MTLPRSGVYVLRYKPTGHIYFGSSVNLFERRKQWRSRLGRNQHNLSQAFKRLLPFKSSDWEFVVVVDGAGMSAVDLERVEHQAVAYARAKALPKVLNELAVQRMDARAYAIDGRVQSLNAWARETGVHRATVHARIKLGWPMEQAVGLAPRPPRDHHDDHREASLTQSRVVVVDRGKPLTQTEAANVLGCSQGTLQKRLRRFQSPSEQVTIELSHLQHLTEKHRAR